MLNSLLMKKMSFKYLTVVYTPQKMKFFVKDLFSKCNQTRSFLRIPSHLLKNALMENFIFCAVMFPLKSNSNSNIMDLKASIPETEPESASESKSECVFDFDIKKQ